jgi:small-conductance mechanosensitive channel
MTFNHTAPMLLSGHQARSDIVTAQAEAWTWLQDHWLQIAVAAAAGVAIYAALQFLRGYAARVCKRGEGVASWYSIIGRALAKTGNIFIILTAARLVIGYADAPPLLARTIVFLFTISAVFQAAVWFRELVLGGVEHRTLGEEHRGQALASALGVIRLLVSIAVFAIALVVVLSNLGVNVTGLVAGLGVGGIAIGLAAQGLFADLFAALAILFDRPFRVGDSISYDKGSGSGTVEAIGLKSTRIRGGNGEERIIANKKLLDFEILNTTRRKHNRFKYEFVLGFGTPPTVVRTLPALLKSVIEEQGYTLVHGGLNGFGVSGLTYDVEFESIEPDFSSDARDAVAAALLELFRAQGIAFAYPTQVNVEPRTESVPKAAQAEL